MTIRSRHAGAVRRHQRGTAAAAVASVVRGTGATTGGRAFSLGLLASALTVGALWLGASPAFALTTHVFSSSFGTHGSGAGQVSSPDGVAVNDATGDVYVADAGNRRVDEFSSTGAFIRAWGWGVADGASSFESCTTTCQAGVSGAGAGQFETPTFIAVDNDASSPSVGDVYVGDTGDNLVTKFDGSGNLVSSWGSAGQLDGSTATNGPFGPLAGIAVDSAGVLYVDDTNSNLFEFAPDGTFSKNFVLPRGTAANGLAVNTGGDIFKVNGDQSVEESDGSGNDIGTVTLENGSPVVVGLAVDPSTGDLYVDDNGVSVDEYRFDGSGNVIEPDGSTCTPVSNSGCGATDTFGSGHLTGAAGLTVDPSHDVYAADAGDQRIDVFIAATVPDVTTGQASNVQETSVTLSGTVNPDGVQLTDCHFEYGTDTSYGQSVPCVPAAGSIAPDSSDHTVTADVTGLASGTSYHFRLVAGNANGTADGEDGTFATPGPTLEGTWSTAVGSADATLNAQLNPNGADATYHFEYGTSTTYGASVPVHDADAGSGTSAVTVSEPVTGLTGGTSYHYRIVVTDTTGTVNGPDRVFTTQPAPSSGADSCPNAALRTGYGRYLPDCRAYEHVSPVDKNSTDAALVTQGNLEDIARVSITGDRFVFGTFGDAFAGEASGQTFDFYMSQRGTDGWTTNGINPPMSPSVSLADLPYTELMFTPGLDAGVADSPPGSALTADTAPGQENKYLSGLGNPGNPSYRLLTPRFPHAVPDATLNPVFPILAGASTDLSHVIYSVRDALTPDAPLTPNGIVGGQQSYDNNLYEWVNGTLRLVNIAPDGTPIASADTQYVTYPSSISADGSRIFFQAAGNLYVRENGTTTVQIDASQGSGPGGGGSFLGANSDGSQVVFRDDAAAGLTPNTVPGSGANLYSYDVNTHALSDLTAVAQANADGLVGMSSDGSYVYFVADGALAPRSQPGSCSSGAGSCSLYVYHGGTTTYIATLKFGDSLDWWSNSSVGSEGGMPFGPVFVTADGRQLAFQSTEPSTGYDNTDANTGAPDSEVYLYDASSNELRCASCNPTGARPEGPSTLSTEMDSFAGSLGHTPQSVSADGTRLFFNSADALTGRDSNSIHSCTASGIVTILPCQDVYEWEAPGAGSCQSASANGGCLDLISSGSSDSSAEFLDATADGSDAFFATRDQLVGQDQDNLYDVYDARVDGGIASQSQPPATSCSGDACRGTLSGPPAPPAAAATVTFSGPGNASSSTPPRTGKARVVQRTVRGTRFLITVTVPRAGRITISGTGIGTVSHSMSHAGADHIRIALTRRARRQLASRRALTLRLRVSYAAAGAPAQTAIVRLTVKPALRHGTRHARRATTTTGRAGR